MDFLRRLSRDEIGGLATAVIGALIMWEASNYPLGTLQHMGPGYFPLWLGIIMVALGVIIALQGFKIRLAMGEDDWPAATSLRALAAISASLLAFGLILPRLGLIPAVIAVAMIAALGERTYRPLTITVTAIALAAVSMVVFVYGFGMPLQPLRWG